MRRIMVDHARQRQTLKRGGGAIRVTLDETAAVTQTRADELLALDEALENLATFDSRKSITTLGASRQYSCFSVGRPVGNQSGALSASCTAQTLIFSVVELRPSANAQEPLP